MQLCGSLSTLWHCLSLELNENLNDLWPVTTAEYSKFAGLLSVAVTQHHLLGFEIAQLEFHHLHKLCSYLQITGLYETFKNLLLE